MDLELPLKEALSSGGDWCDLYIEDSIAASVMLRDGQVSSGAYTRDCGCGVRVLEGEKTGYAYCESTRIEDITDAARAASAIASLDSKRSVQIGESKTIEASGKLYPMALDWRDVEVASFIPGLHKLEEAIRAKESRTDKVRASLSYSLSQVLMYNSLGELTTDVRPLCSLSVSATFRSGSRLESKSTSRSYRMGAEFLSDELIMDTAGALTNEVDRLFEAGRPKGGVMNVVMGAGASGILLHEAMGHAFEADFNRKGQSIFSDKMGKQVCPKGINIVDDGTIPFQRGSINFDDEGVRGQKTYMVTDGILTSYLHDRISASYYGVAPTGNGRRENFRFNPIPRMRCTYMENGSDGTLEDLIRMAGNGIYVDDFSNGEVLIGQGDFTFYVKSGYMIENGRLTAPIKDVNIIGNGPQALSQIRAVASDLRIDPVAWTCGKGQSAAVGCGIPSVLISGLSVGGE